MRLDNQILCKPIIRLFNTRKNEMSNILRLALCGEQDRIPVQEPDVLQETQPDEKSIKMTGPLSEVYTKALQIVYAKTEPDSGVMAVESQANDAFMQIALRKAMSVRNSNIIDPNKLINGYLPTQNTTVAIIDATDVDSSKILSAANTLITDKLADPDNRDILVIDGAQEPTSQYNTLIEKDVDPTVAQLSLKQATENLCQKLGIELYYSFEAFVARL